MKASRSALEAIIVYEGLKLKAYKCPAGIWTIGIGHTGTVNGQTIQEKMVITEAEAMELLQEDVAKIDKYLNSQPFCKRLTQCQYDALTSFIFNVGQRAFETSTMRKKLCLNEPDKDVAAEFGRWVYGTANGKKVILPGLVKRRRKEAAMFLGE